METIGAKSNLEELSSGVRRLAGGDLEERRDHFLPLHRRRCCLHGSVFEGDLMGFVREKL